MGSARNVGGAFFPLDEELELLPGSLTPHAHECLVRFGAWMPFEKAAAELAFSLRVKVSEPTVRRVASDHHPLATGFALHTHRGSNLVHRSVPLA